MPVSGSSNSVVFKTNSEEAAYSHGGEHWPANTLMSLKTAATPVVMAST